MDTLGEIANAIEDDREVLDVLDAAIGTKVSKASNLSDLDNVATARTNLGLGALAVKGVVDATTLIADGIVTYAKLAAGAVATAAELCANTASKLLSVSSLWSAASVVDLGNVSGTVTIDFATGLNFKMTTTGSITLANPTNLKSGQAFGLKIAMGGAHTIAVGSEWRVIGGTAPTYNNTNGTNNYISGQRCDAGIIAYAGGKL
ncbi:hypothetical protein CQ13_06590 [Bradyrhizobium retamae]|uniref:Uncharacterized protein n=1 Tax=Bradyrhizobium retamae TaxID=1300035 RepID=A0A0R3MP57_9BRAD|nr:hypothetical protein CQ13_06590 [Bradyrhizobium retamae]